MTAVTLNELLEIVFFFRNLECLTFILCLTNDALLEEHPHKY